MRRDRPASPTRAPVASCQTPNLDVGDWVLLAETLADRAGPRVRVGTRGMIIANNLHLDGTLTVHFPPGLRATIPPDKLILVAV
jgi:hypothetical protein